MRGKKARTLRRKIMLLEMRNKRNLSLEEFQIRVHKQYKSLKKWITREHIKKLV